MKISIPQQQVFAGSPPPVDIPAGALNAPYQAAAKLGDVVAAIGAQNKQDLQDLARAKAANDFQDYQLKIKQVGLDLAGPLADGTLSAADAPKEFQKRVADIPKPDTANLDPVTAENLNRGIQQAQVSGMINLQPVIRGAVVTEQRAAVDSGMDKIGKAAGMPGADIGQQISAIDVYDQAGQRAYGKDWAKKKQDFIDQTWAQATSARIQQADGNLTGLLALQKDLNNTTDGPYAGHLDTNARTQLLNQVAQTIRGTLAEQNQIQAEQKRQLAQQQDATLQVMLGSLIAHKLTTKDVMNNPVLDFAQKEHMINAIDSQAKGTDMTDTGTFLTLFKRIHASGPTAITSPDQLYPYLGHGLSFADMGKLRSELDGKGTPDGEMLTAFKKQAESQISGSSLISKDPVGDQKFYEWLSYFNTVYDQQRKAGKSAHDLLDPASKDYLGPTINRFVRTPTQQIQDMASRLSASAPQPKVEQRKPGESPEDYLKRTGQQ